MDGRVRGKLEEKVREMASEGPPPWLARLAPPGGDRASFSFGLAAGRLYNSFRYQTRRVLGREPTGDEELEFAGFVGSKRRDLEALW